MSATLQFSLEALSQTDWGLLLDLLAHFAGLSVMSVGGFI